MSLLRGKKPQILPIFAFVGTCTHPLYRPAPNLACLSTVMVYTYLPNVIRISLCHYCWCKTPFWPFLGLWHFVVGLGDIKTNWTRVPKNIPLSSYILSSNTIQVKSRLQHDGLVHRNSTFFAHRPCTSPSAPKLGFMIEDLWHILTPTKCVGIANMGHWKFWRNCTPQF